MTEIAELLQKRAALIERAQTKLAELRAQASPDPLELQEVEKLLEEARRLKDEADRLRKARELEARIAAEQAELERPRDPEVRPPERAVSAYDAFRAWLVHGERRMRPEELRVLQADVDASGGYLFAPAEFRDELIKAIDAQTPIRGIVRTVPLETSDTLEAPELTQDLGDADWTSELSTGTDDDLAFGKRSLTPRYLAKRVKVSRKLLRLKGTVESLVRDRLAYKFAVTEEKAYLTGDGTGKPLGVFVADANGIPTSRDVDVSASTTPDITADGLIRAKYALRQVYWPRARWVCNAAFLEKVAGLKDSNGRFLWQADLTGSQPDRLLGVPVVTSEFAPSDMTTGGAYVAVLGDFQYYWVAELERLEIQRLEELYAEVNQVGFIARRQLDGKPVLAEAFVRCQIT